jgi:hypothetical protein
MSITTGVVPEMVPVVGLVIAQTVPTVQVLLVISRWAVPVIGLVIAQTVPMVQVLLVISRWAVPVISLVIIQAMLNVVSLWTV